MDLRIGAVWSPISGMWGLFRSVCDKLEGQRPIIEGAMDSNAGGVVAGSVHQLMQSDQVILVSAGCLEARSTLPLGALTRLVCQGSITWQFRLLSYNQSESYIVVTSCF
ncbi:hypothetical protein ABBQ38_014460 [Trebouxia sp. C0009 RCD-2024]